LLEEGAIPKTSLDEAGLCSFLLEGGDIPKPSFPKLACPNAESPNPVSPNPVLVLPNSNPFPKSLLNSMAGPLPDEFPKAGVVSLTDWSGVLDEANVMLSSCAVDVAVERVEDVPCELVSRHFEPALFCCFLR
jgi:hypothetical protein